MATLILLYGAKAAYDYVYSDKVETNEDNSSRELGQELIKMSNDLPDVDQIRKKHVEILSDQRTSLGKTLTNLVLVVVAIASAIFAAIWADWLTAGLVGGVGAGFAYFVNRFQDRGPSLQSKGDQYNAQVGKFQKQLPDAEKLMKKALAHRPTDQSRKAALESEIQRLQSKIDEGKNFKKLSS